MDVHQPLARRAGGRAARDIVVRALERRRGRRRRPGRRGRQRLRRVRRGSISSPGTPPKAITAAASTTARGRRRRRDRRVLLGRADARLAPAEARRDRARRRRPLLGSRARGQLGGVQRHEHGVTARRRGRCPSAPAAPDLDGRHRSSRRSCRRATPVRTGGAARSRRLREGGGRIDLVKADSPLVFAAPTSFSFGLLGRRRTTDARSRSTDAGGGAGAWTVRSSSNRAALASSRRPAAVTVPGSLAVRATVAAAAREGDGDAASSSSRAARTSGGSRSGSDVSRAERSARSDTAAHAEPGRYRGNTARRSRARRAATAYPEPRRVRPPRRARSRSSACGSAAGRELRRRGRSRGRGVKVAAADRQGRRREPPRRLHGAAVRPEPVPRQRSAATGPSRGASCPGRGTLRHRLRHAAAARPPGRSVPLLDRRRDAAAVRVSALRVVGGRRAARSRDGGSGVDPRLDRRDGRRAAGRAALRGGVAPLAGGSAGPPPRSCSRSPTTRRRRTWRTSRGSCRTRATPRDVVPSSASASGRLFDRREPRRGRARRSRRTPQDSSGADDLQLALALRAFAAAPRLDAEPALEPRPLSGDEYGDRAVPSSATIQPAHGVDSTRRRPVPMS